MVNVGVAPGVKDVEGKAKDSWAAFAAVGTARVMGLSRANAGGKEEAGPQMSR